MITNQRLCVGEGSEVGGGSFRGRRDRNGEGKNGTIVLGAL